MLSHVTKYVFTSVPKLRPTHIVLRDSRRHEFWYYMFYIFRKHGDDDGNKIIRNSRNLKKDLRAQTTRLEWRSLDACSVGKLCRAVRVNIVTRTPSPHYFLLAPALPRPGYVYTLSLCIINTRYVYRGIILCYGGSAEGEEYMVYILYKYIYYYYYSRGTSPRPFSVESYKSNFHLLVSETMIPTTRVGDGVHTGCKSILHT